MIKRIQLRGISRSPSDRHNADGGCAESLNVQLEQDEVAPAVMPEEVDEIAGKALNGDEVVYIHKRPNFTNIIYFHYDIDNGSELYANTNTSSGVIYSLASEETFVRCFSMGNTLGIITSTGTHWVLWKDGAYKPLGTDVPFPGFSFFALEQAETAFTEEIGTRITRHKYYSEADYSTLNDWLPVVWGDIDIMVANNAKAGVFCYQHMAVLSVKFYSGQRLISAPVLLAGGFENPFRVYTESYPYNSRNHGNITLQLRTAHKIAIRINEDEDYFKDWEDVVEKIEVFLSPPIAANLDRTKYTLTGEYQPYDNYVAGEDHEYKLVLGDENYSYEEQLLHASNFFLAASFGLEKMSELTNNTGVILDTKDVADSTYLQTQEQLDVISDKSHYAVNFDRVTTFNNKVIASGIKETVRFHADNIGISTTEEYLGNTLNYWEGGTNPKNAYYWLHPEVTSSKRGAWSFDALRVVFRLRDSAGKVFTIQATDSEGNAFWEPKRLNLPSDTACGVPLGILMCPDSRAFEAVIEIWEPGQNLEYQYTYGKTVLMTEHPYLPGLSYWFGGADELMEDDMTRTAALESPAGYIDDRPNKLYASDMDNPFLFPISGRYTFSGKVLGTAVASMVLSVGQSGQFPLYVFTDEGLFSLGTTATGTFANQSSVSRDVCVNTDSITPLDAGVLFVTDKGVMLVAGSQVTCLSENMNGQHFKIDPDGDLDSLLRNHRAWEALLSAMEDDTPFMKYIKSAMIAYDYAGSRLVFIKPDEVYQYVYMLKSATWHKIAIAGDGNKITHVLNLFPDCYLNIHGSSADSVYRLSTMFDAEGTGSQAGVIITRPLDLGEPDVRKAIKSIRIRGQFNYRTDTQYILLGSFDGYNWNILKSLRGGSYKLFRLIILCNLSPNERITWVDVDYETRFNNRLR